MFYDTTTGSKPRALWPSDIAVHTHSRTIELAWGNERATLSHRELRLACRCAECENARRKGIPGVFGPDDVQLQRIEPIGESGLRFFFSDGHSRGIFPWAYLHHLAFGSV